MKEALFPLVNRRACGAFLVGQPMTLWDAVESVKKFANEHPEIAKYYPEDDSFLLDKEETSDLYEVFFEK